MPSPVRTALVQTGWRGACRTPPRRPPVNGYFLTVSWAVMEWVSVKPVWVSTPVTARVQVPAEPLVVYTVTVALFVPPFGVTKLGVTVHE